MEACDIAKERVESGLAKLIFVKNNQIILEKTQNGVAGALEAYENESRLIDGAHAVDKIVGKGAAIIFVLAKVKSVYAFVISEAAKKVFSKNGIHVKWQKCVPYIANRSGNGVCPIEQSIEGLDNPNECFGAIKTCLYELKTKR